MAVMKFASDDIKEIQLSTMTMERCDGLQVNIAQQRDRTYRVCTKLPEKEMWRPYSVYKTVLEAINAANDILNDRALYPIR